MDRKSFFKSCGVACLGVGYMVSFLESCGATKRITAPIEASDMVVPLSAFEIESKKGPKYQAAVIADNEQLQDPICVFRGSDGLSYTAVLMRCTHQGAQLQLFGDKLQCPAHGSEFDPNGAVLQGPASDNLRTFPITIQGSSLRISLQ
jgi:Rieske Fe-S protein